MSSVDRLSLLAVYGQEVKNSDFATLSDNRSISIEMIRQLSIVVWWTWAWLPWLLSRDLVL